MDARAVVFTSNKLPTGGFTLCMWMRTIDTFGGLVTYTSPTAGVEWALRLGDVATSDPSSLYLRVHGVEGKSKLVKPADGLWHYLCVRWAYGNNTFIANLDARDEYDSMQLGTADNNAPLATGGCMTVGQLNAADDKNCSMFQSAYSYEGYVADLTVWSAGLSQEQVTQWMPWEMLPV